MDSFPIKREIPVDIAKGIGIILVVAGHSIISWRSQNRIWYDFIFSFHMSLFLAISCVFIAKHEPIKSFIKSKFERFLLPYLFWVGIYFFLTLAKQIAKLFLSDMVRMDSPPHFFKIKEMFHVLLFANFSALSDSLGVFLHLWFLPAVFSLVIIQHIILSIENDKIRHALPLILIMASYSIVTLNNNYNFHSKVPFGIDIAIVCLPFVYIANLREYFLKLNSIFILLCFMLIFFLSQNINVGAMRINNYFSFFLTSCAGIIMVLLVSFKLKSHRIGNKLAKIGTCSYAIYVMHIAVFDMWMPFAKKIPILENEEMINVSSFILGIIVPILIFPIFKKWRALGYLAFGEKTEQKNMII